MRNLPMTYLRIAIVLCCGPFSTLSACQTLNAQEGKGATPPQEQTELKRPKNLPDGINASFLDPDMDVDDFIKRFEVESREVFACREQIVTALRLKPGLAVADVGAGTGLFLSPLAKAVEASGKVFAIDISPKFASHLRQRARDEALPQVQVVLCSDRSINLKKESVDRVLICDVYHHFEFPSSSLASIYASMRNGAELVLIDFNIDVEGERGAWLKNHVRAPKEVFKQEVLDAGFKFVEEVRVDGFVENYLLRFVKE